MSGVELDGSQAWEDSFSEAHDQATRAAEKQPGWKLTALGITIGVMALLMLSV